MASFTNRLKATHKSVAVMESQAKQLSPVSDSNRYASCTHMLRHDVMLKILHFTQQATTHTLLDGARTVATEVQRLCAGPRVAGLT